MSIASTYRPIKLFCLLALSGVALIGSIVVETDRPNFVKETIFSPNTATVAAVVPSLNADIVVLDGGLEQGLRHGMVCSINRGFLSIGELIIIESRSDCSAGLILELAENATIQTGDIARVKVITTS